MAGATQPALIGSKRPAMSGRTDPDPPERLRNNIAALSLVQICNYVIPFLTLPYLTRVLGPEAYGRIAFAQVLMTYFMMLTDFGFSWSATRKISAHRTDRAYVSRAFFGTWFAQWLLVLVSAAIAALVVTCTKRLRPDALLYAAAFTTVVGNALFPVWFLQGLERLQLVASVQVLMRLLALLPIFLIVTRPDDLIFVPLINGTGAILGGILALTWIAKKRFLDWHWPGWNAVIAELREGLPLFGSRVWISFYTTLVPLTLGWFAGPVAVAHFAVADKIRTALQSAMQPLSQALFPRMARLVMDDVAGAGRLLRRAAIAILIIGGSGGLFLLLFSGTVISLVAGSAFRGSDTPLRIMAFVPLIIQLSSLASVQVLLAHNENRKFNAIIASCSIAGLPFLYFTSMKAEYSAAFMLAIETVIMSVMILAARKILRRKLAC